MSKVQKVPQYVICQINGQVTPVSQCLSCYYLNVYHTESKNSYIVDCGSGFKNIKHFSHGYDYFAKIREKSLKRLYTEQFAIETECESCHEKGSYASYGGQPKLVLELCNHISNESKCCECNAQIRIRKMVVTIK